MYFGRGKNKIQNPYVFEDTYISYIEKVDKGSPYDVSYQEYVKICNLFYKMLIDYLFLKNGRWVMPHGIGAVSVRKTKTDINKPNMPIDWKLTTEYNKKIYHLNEHTSGYKYGFYWEKKTFAQKYKAFYAFALTRTNKRRLAKLIKSGEYDYFEI